MVVKIFVVFGQNVSIFKYLFLLNKKMLDITLKIASSLIVIFQS